MRRIIARALVAAVAATTALVLLTSSSSATLRDRIVAAALAQKSVHWTGVSFAVHVGSTLWRSDVTRDSGAQRGTFPDGGRAQIRLVDDTVYVRGGAKGLKDAIGLTGSEAQKYAGQWISISPGDKAYRQTAAGLTLASVVDDLSLRGNTKVQRWKSRGRPRLTVQVNSDGEHEVLSAYASNEQLPVRFEDYWDAGGPYFGVRFSKWNEPVHVQAPAHSIPIAEVRD